jgi:hypothetical protein
MKRILLTAAFALGFSAQTTVALDAQSSVENVLNTQLLSWINEPAVISAIRAQNALHADITDADILELDTQWRDEIGATDTPLQTQVTSKAVSVYLNEKQHGSNGIVSEVFLMDEHGLNVGQSNLTSDYWQGDEAKFQESFGKGAGSVHVGEVELDESTGAYLVQISSTIVDPDSGTPIGAVTFGINIGLLE